MGKKILLADDSITIQKVIELTFSDEDFEVVTVGNGRLAVERVAEVAPDVVLCDIIMPEKDGYEVCDYIKKNAALAHVPVLLLTGAFEPFDQERAARVGADGYLAKPFEPQTLIAKVKEMLERGPAPRAAAPSPEVVRHATVPVPSETTPMVAVRPTPVAPAPAPADFEPLYAVEEPTEFQPLEASGGFEPLEAASYEPLADVPAESPLDDFVGEPTFAAPERDSSATLAFIPEEPLPPPRPPLPPAVPVEVDLVGEPELVAEPEFTAEPEPELVAEPEPEPAVGEAELVAEAELVSEPDLLVVDAPEAAVAPAGPVGLEGGPEPAAEAVFEEPAEFVAEADTPAPGEAAVEFEALPAAGEPAGPVSVTAEVPLEERARAAVEAAYGAVFAADEPFVEEPPAAVQAEPPAPGGEAVFEFEPEPDAAPVEAVVSAATEELAPEELEIPEEPVIPAEPVAAAPAAPEATFEEATFEEAFEAPPEPAAEPPLEGIDELTEPEPEPVTAPQAWAAAPPTPEPPAEALAASPAEEVSFEDVAPAAAEAPAAASGPSLAAEVGVPVEMVAAIAQRVVGQISEKVIREVAWEIIPELAEALIKKEIERLRAELDRLPK